MLCYFRTRSTELEGQTRKRYTLHCFLLPPPHPYSSEWGVWKVWGLLEPQLQKKESSPQMLSSQSPSEHGAKCSPQVHPHTMPTNP